MSAAPVGGGEREWARDRFLLRKRAEDGWWTELSGPDLLALLDAHDAAVRERDVAVREVEELRAENAALKDEVQQWKDDFEPRIGSDFMQIANGEVVITMTGAHKALERMADVMTTLLDGNDAKNYVSIEATKEGKRYAVVVQRLTGGARTPHEMRQRAEAANDRVRVIADRIRDERLPNLANELHAALGADS